MSNIAATAQSSLAIGIQGFQRAQEATADAATQIAGGSLDPEVIVSLTQSALAAEVSAAVIKLADQSLGTLLDVLA